MTPEAIAEVAHEAIRALQRIINDPANPVSLPWNEASVDIRQSAIAGVMLHLQNPLTPRESHAAWCEYKVSEGWVYGEVKDENAKTHPCLVDYDMLSQMDKLKDILFKNVVNALS